MTGIEMTARKKYYVTDIELHKGSAHQSDTLCWKYAGEEYSCTGNFYIDNKGFLQHTFFTPRGKERTIKITYLI